ncbi:MAG: WecB/TagA/CpsF family glycosyltransferase, partial [Pseudomonadota bacterium]
QTLVGVGAAFDFLSGEVKVAPAWMRKRGLESVYRLISEPRRLWRRYLILVPKFLLALLREGSLGTLIKGARNMPTK